MQYEHRFLSRHIHHPQAHINELDSAATPQLRQIDAAIQGSNVEQRHAVHTVLTTNEAPNTTPTIANITQVLSTMPAADMPAYFAQLQNKVPNTPEFTHVKYNALRALNIHALKAAYDALVGESPAVLEQKRGLMALMIDVSLQSLRVHDGNKGTVVTHGEQQMTLGQLWQTLQTAQQQLAAGKHPDELF